MRSRTRSISPDYIFLTAKNFSFYFFATLDILLNNERTTLVNRGQFVVGTRRKIVNGVTCPLLSLSLYLYLSSFSFHFFSSFSFFFFLRLFHLLGNSPTHLKITTKVSVLRLLINQLINSSSNNNNIYNYNYILYSL